MRPPLRIAGSVLAPVLLAATLSACVSARNTLGTSSSPCFRAVPVASEAVNDRGTLAGIRLVSQKSLERYPRLALLLDRLTGSASQNVCVVAFHGSYSPSQVEKPLEPATALRTGKVAIVIVTTPQNRLVGTVILEREPLPLRHLVERPAGISGAGPPSRPVT